VPQQRGGGANSNSGLGSERTAWLLLIGMLEKKCARQAQNHRCLLAKHDRLLLLSPCNFSKCCACAVQAPLMSPVQYSVPSKEFFMVSNRPGIPVTTLALLMRDTSAAVMQGAAADDRVLLLQEAL
jgi:hypothetical protein